MPVDEYDPEDYFKDSRMSFWDHIEELRRHLWLAIIGFGVALIAGLCVGEYAVHFIASPVEKQLSKFYDQRVENVKKKRMEGKDEHITKLNEPQVIRVTLTRRHLADAVGVKLPAGMADDVELELKYRPLELAEDLAAAEREVGRRPTLSTLSVTEGFIVYFKVSMYVGLILAAPWIFFQLWSFIAAGLYPNEKRLVHVYLPFSIVLFLLGVFLCQFLVIPVAIKYLLSFNEWMDLEPDLRLNEWLSFAIMMPLLFGVAFQLPMLMFALYRIGIVDVTVYTKNRRIAMFLMAVLAIILSASPDVFSMMSLTVPLWVLYEVGILMCRWSPRPQYESDESEPEEMIEV